MPTRLTIILLGLLVTIVSRLESAPALTRVPNTTLSLPAAPPQFGYSVVDAFPGLGFIQPVCIASPPGETNRLFILERLGDIAVITNLARPTRTIFMHLNVTTSADDGLLGLAFHPDYQSNHYFYVFSTCNLNTSQGNGRHNCLSRFEASPDDPNVGLIGSELPLISQFEPYDYHHGGDLHFGPDGYLYVSLGDGGPQVDGDFNSQTITKNFFSGLLRLDVDQRPGNLAPNPHPASSPNYSIPADNPFVGATAFNGLTVDPAMVRTEFFAVGLREPWRMSFDRVTGQLYVGDVGLDNREEVDLVTKGGNYGWIYREGLQPGFRLPAPPGFEPIDPIHEYAHGSGPTQGNAIIGGLVYRGPRLSQLYGAYVFADFVDGNVWMLRADGTNSVPSQRLTGATLPAGFGTDPRDGEMLIAELTSKIRRLVYDGTPVGAPLPPTLADTGAFSDLATLTAAPGIVPYELNVPFWSDGALKRRWFSVPDVTATIGFSREGNWSFPSGAIWIKHFDLELTNGVPESRRRLETRFIVRNADGVYGITYRWDDAQTNASLVPEEGLDETFEIHDGDAVRTQTWRYPSRAECLACHTAVGGGALGFTTAQLNRVHDYDGTVDNQIHALSQAGYFSTEVTNIHTLRAHVAAGNSSASLESRVRSYLTVNCAQCHQPGGPTSAAWDARLNTLTADAGLIDGHLRNNFGNDDARVIKPGSPDLSVMLQRISTRGPTQMPPLASHVVDAAAVQLLTEWINTDSVSFRSFAEWQAANFADPLSPDAGPAADPDHDGVANYLEFLVRSDPNVAGPPWTISAEREGNVIRIRFPRKAGRGFEVQSTTNPFDAASWQSLNVPGNEPFFSAADVESVVEDGALDGAQKFYRVRVFEE